MFKELDSRKLVIISASILALMGFRWLSKGSSVQEWKEQSAGFSYEMPRVSSYGNEFDLSGREIDRQIMSDEKKDAAKVVSAKDAKKDDKKAKAKDAKKQAKKDSSKKKKEFDTKVVDTRSLESMSSTGETEGEEQFAGGAQNFEEYEKKNSKETAKNNKDQDADEDKDEKELSTAQWRALLSQTPSAENIAKLVKAHTSGKISDQDFYGIVFDFFNESSGSPRYEAALAILGQDKSPTQFLYLAKNYGKVDQSRRSTLWNLMLGFAQAGRITALNGALVSQDQGTVQMGLQVLKYAVDQQTQNRSQGPRNVAMAGPQAFVIFIGPLNALTKQQNENTQLAQTVLAGIQVLLNH